MKKILTILTGITLIFLTLGCSRKDNSTIPNNPQPVTESYQNLNPADKKKVSFKFNNQTDSTDPNDPTHSISATITNKTDKIVKISKEKLALWSANGYRLPSTKDITLQPGQTKKIHDLFKNVAEDTLITTKSAIHYGKQKLIQTKTLFSQTELANYLARKKDEIIADYRDHSYKNNLNNSGQ